MDTLIPAILVFLALIGFIATVAGVESRDGFDASGAGLEHLA